MADAARRIGEESSQGLRDVCSGRKRASAELVSKLAAVGADVFYILTGTRSGNAPALAVEQQREGYSVLGAAIDWPLMEKILDMLEKTASKAGKRWTERRKIKSAVDIYNFLSHEGNVDEAKMERVLRLVVNQ